MNLFDNKNIGKRPDPIQQSFGKIHMRIGTHVEYQTDPAQWGHGHVTEFNEMTEIVTVIDDDDGSMWRGPVDLTTVIVVDE